MPVIDVGFVETASGRVHVASCGTGLSILLLHQTPRSWDEYRAVLPLLGRRFRAIAMDTPGFGESPPQPIASIEAWAETALNLLTALGCRTAAVVGHHTGAVIAMQMAAQAPDRVTSLVLSACSYVDEARRAHHADQRVIDDVAHAADGSHLTELWARRRPFYPAQTDLLNRYIIDALRAGPMAVDGHRAVHRYRMEDAIGRVRAPTLVIAPLADPNAEGSRRVAAAIKGSLLHEIPDGMVPLPDAQPNLFAQLVTNFIANQPQP